MESVLRTLGYHPFLTVKQLLRMLDASRSSVYEKLQALRDDGLVATVNLRSPSITGPQVFYYATLYGARHLGLEQRKGRPCFLERIDLTFELRNFLVSAQRAGMPIAEWQVLPPAVDRVSLHAVARSPNGNELIIEWDRGERPIREYRTRLRKLLRVAAKANAGLLLVAADKAHGTTMLASVGTHMDLKGPVTALTTRALIAAKGLPEAACYVPALRESLSIGGFVETLPRKSDGVPLMTLGVMGFKGTWQGNAKLAVQLRPMQKTLLSILAGVPLITAQDIATLAGDKSPEWAERSLRGLWRLGLVERYTDDDRYLVHHYHLTGAGVDYLAAQSGMTLRAYAKARGIVLTNDGEVSVAYLTRVFEHTVQARKVVMTFAEEARRSKQPVSWYDENEARVWFSVDGHSQLLVPDARVHWGQQVLFLEIDRDTVGEDQLKSKLRVYYRFRACAEYRRFGNNFRLLVIAPDPGREAVWLGCTNSLAKEYGTTVLPVATTTLGAITGQGVNEPIWRDIQSTKRKKLGSWL